MVHKIVWLYYYITFILLIVTHFKITNDELTNREREVLTSLSDGRLHKEIASDYKISIDTVKKHCKNIYRKLNVRNRTEATMILLSQIK